MKTTSLVSLGAVAALAIACSSSSGSPGNGNGGSSGSGSGSSGSGSSGSGSSSGDDSSSGAGSGSGSGSGSGGGDDAGGYPAGPYGIAVGDVITDMQWIGYVDPTASEVATSEPYVVYSLNDARTSGAHYAMIHLAETECPGCQMAATQLEAGGAAVVQAGGVMIEVLETTGFIATASQTDLEQWIGKYQLPITSVKDPGTATVTLDTLGRREQAYIIDLTTMKILDVFVGNTDGGGAATSYSAEQGMAEMHTLLGK